MASVFDFTHETGHALAGLLGVGCFPFAATLPSLGLGRAQAWSGARRPLLWVANLSWISVLLLAATLGLMTMAQFSKVNGGHLPKHVRKSLPAGVLGPGGWADRLIALSNCGRVLVAAWGANVLHRQAR